MIIIYLVGYTMTEVIIMEDILYILIIILVYRQLKRYSKIEFKIHKKVGDKGEKIVAQKLSQLNDDYIVINNVHYGRTQIDHLVLCHNRKCIFVIETKMWGGIITGKFNDRQWIQNKNGKFKMLDNPILQNKYHCRVVKKRYPRYEIFNVVVFVGNNNVPESKCIIRVNNLVDYIYKVSNSLSNKCLINI